jgi:DNA (cytosine-5)-methyltransferase 1
MTSKYECLNSIGTSTARTASASSSWIFALSCNSSYYKVSEAADYLSVSPNTIRNWVNAEKIASIRHPMNSYRLFRREDITKQKPKHSTNNFRLAIRLYCVLQISD